MDVKKIKLQIIKAGEKAVQQLIKVAEEQIIKYGEDDELAADKLKNAFEILKRIQEEKDEIEGVDNKTNNAPKGFAESRST